MSKTLCPRCANEANLAKEAYLNGINGFYKTLVCDPCFHDIGRGEKYAPRAVIPKIPQKAAFFLAQSEYELIMKALSAFIRASEEWCSGPPVSIRWREAANDVFNSLTEQFKEQP